jgi:hypothetical protein
MLNALSQQYLVKLRMRWQMVTGLSFAGSARFL